MSILPKKPSEVPRGLFNAVFSWMLKQRIGQIEDFMKHPHQVQEQTFQRLISQGAKTIYGKDHGFSQIRNVEEYRARVPIQDYEDFQPYVERLMKGEQGLLWPSEVKWFAKSSGTTSARSKFIPVSKEALEECHFAGGKDLMSLYCYQIQDTKIFSGRGLVMGGSHQVNKLSENSWFGDVSAVMMQNMPMAARFIRTPDLSIALMEDWEEKIDRMAEMTMKQNVTHIAGVPTWTIVLIEHLFKKTGASNLLEIWPNLELYIHGGVSFSPYRKRFAELIPSADMHYVETYNASEGFFAIQDQLGSQDLLLMLDYGVFYEFIPLSEMDREQPRAVGLESLEVGKVYALVISTNAGLWRYRIGDTIRVCSTDPFRIQVAGRIRHFINAFGEELIVENADRGIEMASAATGALVREYTAAPIYFEAGEKGGHEWLIEFDSPPKSLEHFTRALDEALQDINSDYAAKRHKGMALSMPVVRAVEPNTFYNWLKSKGKLGGQHKVPRLSNERSYLEEILAQIRS